ncbi:MAG TPA: phosphatase PAP2 family protein [Cellvibrio sp.]|nr:phosphatase PAP2 family protein [Cellvibrio sp.]
MPLQTPDRQLVFWRNHFYIPLCIFVFIAVAFELGHTDTWLADKFYALEGGTWALKNAWITSTIIHQTGKKISLFIAAIILAALAISYLSKYLRRYRREFAYLLLAAGGSSALISVIKSISHVSCAWDFSRYGGTAVYTDVYTQILNMSGENCFPAGHASGGYAWLAFYFLGVYKESTWRWIGLSFALGVGLVFGISQQLRGAHFISHDLWTLGICWFFSLFIFKLMLLGQTPQQQ